MMVISESVGSTNGIGRQLYIAQQEFDIPTMWGVIVLLGVLGLVLNASFLLVERRVLAWHRLPRQSAPTHAAVRGSGLHVRAAGRTSSADASS